jgi:hypothetical protein
MFPSPRSQADRAEDFPTTYPAPTSHSLKGSGGEVAGRAIAVRRNSPEHFTAQSRDHG